ncbi:TPA: peptide chain release factor N(5)-glutamine methyltransferase [Candidatus Saccharibacteria bacterium]|nr:peptide chain release factor N(5)-glutamine methyltransferase [Candidatus Saccharibacteria bacterium]HRK41391.1 peptide chain release factor N(5)-glutamine methyltransferase [Candidatus Saccharibacteria bacterium]
MTVEEWLIDVTEQFTRANIPTARLDAELILCHMLGVERSWLVAHGDESLARAALANPKGVRPGGISVYGDKLVLRRLKREPLAYLFAKKEFYGRDFFVNKHVLIPRPETEALIELAKKHSIRGKVIDVGCGSGVIGLTLVNELQDITLTLSDASPDALEVAEKNAKSLRARGIEFVRSDLLEEWLETDTRFDSIVANLPYVDRAWDRSPETNHEPAFALFADDGGLALIKRLVDQCEGVLASKGYLLLEADPEQHDEIVRYATQFKDVERLDYALLLEKL